MSPDQRKVLGGMAGGAATALAVLALGWTAGPAIGAALPSRRIVALSAVLLALPLALGVGKVAARRFFGPGIDGGSPPGDAELDLGRRILTNHAEQTLLATLALAALVAALPAGRTGGALVYAAVFFAARLAFAISYRRGGLARAYGFAATFYTTLLALATAAGVALFG